MTTPTAQTPSKEEQQELRRRQIVAAPFAALAVQSTGIHPSTSRLVSIDLVTLTPEGEIIDEFHAVVNPSCDIGPFHLHGLTPDEVENGKKFEHILRALDRLIDGRTLIVHNAPRVWGFIVSESRRALKATNQRGRGRNRNRGGRRRRTGHVPRPELIVDTLASARRQGLVLPDTRIRGVAKILGVDTPPAEASVERAQIPESEFTRTETKLVADMYFKLADGPLAQYEPSTLRADAFGLQRSNIRVDAVEAPRPISNPGHYVPGTRLKKGMEIVVSPEIEMDPDDIISAALDAELVYSEKLTRQTSLVVCNQTRDLFGKAMHAQRKGIPLLSDAAFLNLVEAMRKP